MQDFHMVTPDQLL